jgi:hypothetical protein
MAKAQEKADCLEGTGIVEKTHEIHFKFINSEHVYKDFMIAYTLI